MLDGDPQPDRLHVTAGLGNITYNVYFGIEIGHNLVIESVTFAFGRGFRSLNLREVVSPPIEATLGLVAPPWYVPSQSHSDRIAI